MESNIRNKPLNYKNDKIDRTLILVRSKGTGKFT